MLNNGKDLKNIFLRVYLNFVLFYVIKYEFFN
jgi:hypothetical protein